MIRKNQALFAFFIVLTVGFVLIGLPALMTQAAPDSQTPDVPVSGIYRGVSPVVKFDVSPPLREITPAEPDFHAALEIFDDLPSGLEGPLGPQDTDPLVQQFTGTNLIPSPLASFNGPPNVAGFTPPDPVGDVGPNHYVAMSNVHFAVYSKTGTLLFGPVANNTLWAGFGGDCQTDNSGDPIVIYDQLADRWLLTQFTASGPTYFNCIAISTSGDPTGSYFRYAVGTGTNFPDYPKYGVWSDAYYISTREFGAVSFAGVGAYALSRAELIAGNPNPTIISFLVPPGGTPYNVGDGLLPADLDGSTLPPNGSPEYFVGSMDNGGPYGAPQDALTLWKFTADFNTPANSSFVLANTIPVASFDSIFPCTPSGSRSCIPQPGTSVKIDILSYRQRPTWRLAYRNFGTHEALVTNQSVEAATGIAGVRWWEIRDPNGTPTIFQQGTYAPGVTDGIHRWMGSIAMDQDGNMGLGYSASSSSTFPSIWYTGRLAGDPLGTMPQGEGSIQNGTGSQTSSGSRWGDYTSMNIDPVDDCTFWYVNEYLPTTSTAGWQLRIGAFKFPTCGGGGGPTPTPTITPTATNTPPPGANELHVASITMAVVPNGNNRFHAEALVTVHDENNQPISGATVSGNFTGDSSSSASGVTNASGQVTLASTIARFGVNWTFCVTNLAKTGYTYNPAANLETCDSTGGGPTATPTPTATPPPGGTMHLGDLDGTSAPGAPGRWNATVTITVHDASHNPVAGITVSAAWSSGATGTGSCVTNASGQCALTKTGIRNSINSVTLSVTNATGGGLTYTPADNHDPDGDSNGTVITVNKP